MIVYIYIYDHNVNIWHWNKPWDELVETYIKNKANKNKARDKFSFNSKCKSRIDYISLIIFH